MTPLLTRISHRRADNFDTIHRFFERRGWVETRGQHGHLMAAPGKSLGQALGINGQAGSVRAIIGENGEDSHQNTLNNKIIGR